MTKKNYLRAQPFTSLMTNQHQDINSIPQINSLGDAFNGTFPWSNCSRDILEHESKWEE